jgi:hypothetical protein
MTVLCDFVVIQGDVTKVMGDSGAVLWEKTFNTGGRRSGGNAILMMMVRGLTQTTSNVPVKINNKDVGYIFNYNGANANHWFTQIINIGQDILKDGNNEFQIGAVSWPGAKAGDLYDDFAIRDVVCFFQQSS